MRVTLTLNNLNNVSSSVVVELSISSFVPLVIVIQLNFDHLRLDNLRLGKLLVVVVVRVLILLLRLPIHFLLLLLVLLILLLLLLIVLLLDLFFEIFEVDNSLAVVGIVPFLLGSTASLSKSINSAVSYFSRSVYCHLMHSVFRHLPEIYCCLLGCLCRRPSRLVILLRLLLRGWRCSCDGKFTTINSIIRQTTAKKHSHDRHRKNGDA